MGTPDTTIPMRVRPEDRDRIFRHGLAMSADMGRQVSFAEALTDILDRLEALQAEGAAEGRHG